MCALFSPEILRAVAMKGVIGKEREPAWLGPEELNINSKKTNASFVGILTEQQNEDCMQTEIFAYWCMLLVLLQSALRFHFVW